MPELRIVPQELWNRVKARQAEQRAKSEHVRKALHTNARTGAGPKYLFSGFLKCAACGANYVQADSYRYACSTGAKDHPFTRGVLCAKVNDYEAKTYASDRLL
jgi:anaerobic selenocysteine-containing dehydrogenase